MPLPRASADPTDAAQTARILRRKSPLLPADFAKLDREAKKRAITVTDEVSLDAIRSMRDALAKAKADGVEYAEFVKTVGPKLGAQWGIDSPQLKTILVNNVQQAANQAIVARLNRQRGKYPYWTLAVVKDEVTSSTCGYFLTHPVVLPAGHSWFARNAPMRHHRCRTTLRGLTAAQARKIGISKEPPNWPPEDGWGGSAPMGEYKANLSDVIIMASEPARYSHIDFVPPKGAQQEARRGLEWRREYGRGGTEVGVARARDISNRTRLSPETVRRMKAFFDRHQSGAGKGSKPGEDGYPSPWRIAWALWGGDPGYAWARKVVEQMNSADTKKMSGKEVDMGKKVNADLGQGDVHTDGPVKVRRMKPITTEQRKALPRDKFALPETRQYPIHDAAHARNAMARLEQQKGSMPAAKYKRAKENILGAYKRFGIKHEGKPVKGRFMGRPVKGLSFRFTPRATMVEVRHMSDRTIQCPSVEIDVATLLEDSTNEPPRRVWNQINVLGFWKGHPSGPFQITPQINAEIVRNFRATQNQRIPVDFEHASEQSPTDGKIPTVGAPAQGWIYDLDDRGGAGLWGLFEWLEPARSYIKGGKYKSLSPAIRFGSKDRVTGQPIGARLTSVALTNNPFLDGMMPLAASDRGGTTVDNVETNQMGTVQMKMGEYEFEAADVMPKLRMGLFGTGTHQADFATAQECYDAVCRLEAGYAECVDDAPGAEQMRMQGALKRLREVMNLGMGMTVPEMIALVKRITEHMIGIHEDEYHEVPPSSREMGNTTMADQDTTIKLRDAETRVATLMSDLQARDTELAGLKLTLKDRDATIAAQSAELVTLRDNEKQRAEADEKAAVETAYATYKDVKKLTDLDKEQMLLTYRGNPELFGKLYPPVAPDQRHLQRNLSARQSPGAQNNGVLPMTAAPTFMMSQNAWNGAQHPAGQPIMNKNGYGEQLFRLTEEKVRNGMSREQATIEARRELNAPAPVHT